MNFYIDLLKHRGNNKTLIQYIKTKLTSFLIEVLCGCTQVILCIWLWRISYRGSKRWYSWYINFESGEWTEIVYSILFKWYFPWKSRRFNCLFKWIWWEKVFAFSNNENGWEERWQCITLMLLNTIFLFY